MALISVVQPGILDALKVQLYLTIALLISGIYTYSDGTAVSEIRPLVS
jgi:hypothetical protein